MQVEKEPVRTVSHNKLNDLEPTNWFVITGGPSTGKSTLISFLKQIGYWTVTEAARDFIDIEMAAGRTIEQIRADETSFQISVLRLKEQREAEAPSDKLILWDRGLHGNSAAYWLYAGDYAISKERTVFSM